LGLIILTVYFFLLLPHFTYSLIFI
jgi:hypothetical protein